MRKFCSYCGKAFQSQRSNRLYCSDNCKQFAYYKRNASMLQGSDIAAISLHDADNDKRFKNSIKSSLMDQLNVILNAIIDQEVEKRIAHQTHTATATKPFTGKRFDPEHDHGSAAKNVRYADNNAVKESSNVKRNFAVNRKTKSGDLIEKKSLNVKRFTDEVKPDNSKANVIESIHDIGNNALKESESVKRNFTVDHDHTGYVEPVSEVDNSITEEDESDAIADDTCIGEDSVKDSLKQDFVVNGYRHNQTDEDETDSEDDNDTMEPEPVYNDDDATENDNDADDLFAKEESFNGKQNSTVNGKNSDHSREDNDDDNELNLDELDQMIEDIKQQKIKHSATQFPDEKEWNQNNSADQSFDVNRNSAKRETVKLKQPYKLNQIQTTRDSSLNDTLQNTRKDTDKGIDANWVFSTFTSYIHHNFDYDWIDYSGFTDNNGRKVLQVFKCMVKHLICLSNRKPISRHNLLVLTDIFKKLTISDNFKCLSRSFPHHQMIATLTKKLQALEKVSRKAEIKLRFTLKFRAELYTILYAMDDNVKDIRIREIRFSKAA